MVVAERNFLVLSASLLIDAMAFSILVMILVDREAAKSSSARSSIKKATATIAFLTSVGILASTAKEKSISANFGLLYCSPDKI